MSNRQATAALNSLATDIEYIRHNGVYKSATEALLTIRNERDGLLAERDRLREALNFYAKTENLERFVGTVSNDIKGTSWGELDPDISNTARAALSGEGTTDGSA